MRELNVYSILLPHDTPWSEIARRQPKAVILSGGPASVYDEGAPHPDPAIWTGGVPVLGICYGRAADGSSPGRGGGHQQHAGVRTGIARDHDRGRALPRHRADAAGLDEPRRSDRPPADRLPAHCRDRVERLRRPRRSKCQLGQSYEVANKLADAELASEIYSTAGHFDLLVKFYVDDKTDIGHFVNEKVQTISGIQDTHTIITFKAF